MKRLGIILIITTVVAALCTTASADGLSAKRHDFPNAGGYQVLTGDFHMHTIFSDGRLTPRERTEESYKLGYDVICITDHGKTNAYRVAKYVGNPLGLVVLKGLETGVHGNEHMNALDVSDTFVPANPHHWSKKPGEDAIFYQDAMKRIAEDGAFLIYNHPHCGYDGPANWGVENGMVNGIEVKNDVVKNGWKTTEWNGIYCYPEAFDYALKHNLTMFANTDAHANRNEPPGMTLLLVTDRSPKGVMDAIKGRRTAAWFEGVVWGPEDIVSQIIGAAVTATSTTDGKLSLVNECPITLKAKIEDTTPAEFEIPAYQTTTVDLGNSSNSINMIWSNVWVDPRTNLQTTLSIGE